MEQYGTYCISILCVSMHDCITFEFAFSQWFDGPRLKWKQISTLLLPTSPNLRMTCLEKKKLRPKVKYVLSRHLSIDFIKPALCACILTGGTHKYLVSVQPEPSLQR